MQAYHRDDELEYHQKIDLDILMSLKTTEERQVWIESVDDHDFYYGLALLQVAAIKEIEYELDKSNDYADAVNLIEYIKSLN